MFYMENFGAEYAPKKNHFFFLVFFTSNIFNVTALRVYSAKGYFL